MTAQSESKTEIIFHQDSPDVDNIGALGHAVRLAETASDVELIIILEPRLVDFSLEVLNPDNQAHLDSLLKNHFDELGIPPKIRLNGLLEHEAIDRLAASKEDKDLLRMAVNASKDPKPHGSLEARRKDSELHATLMARDVANYLNKLPELSQGKTKITIHVDMVALSDTGPVNLKCHAREHLFNRSVKQIKDYDACMALPEEERRKKTMKWYEDCIEEANKALQNSRFLVQNLDFHHLTKRIKATESVTFIEGASLHLLRRLAHDPEVAAKINCVVQAGTLDLTRNIFANQFNIALDRESAIEVLRNWHVFRSFVAVPTHTSQSILFSFDKLEENGFSTLARWILGYTYGQDPIEVAEGKVTLADSYQGKSIKMPDLAMVLLAFDSEEYPRETSRVEVQMQGESLLFVKSERGIPIFLPKDGHTYEAVDLAKLLTSKVKGSFRIDWGT
ncbi:hypothetical protein FAGAP_954 [Fusarium agapanthi]|uniref:Uncharacterized protein n=1 Tax=Fusarium agapanthi TaxID=1803897 RepID=A0A9P5BJ63_9HYPO|nr:hypothetical protein FAGAP_954 [Fusarium agapanthi]